MKNLQKKLLISLSILLIMIVNVIPLRSITVFAAESKDLIIDMSMGTLNIDYLMTAQLYALDLMINKGIFVPLDDGNITYFKDKLGKELFYVDWNTKILTVSSNSTAEDNIIYTITDNDRNEIFADYEDIVIKFGYTHTWSIDWTNDNIAHWHECIDDECNLIENSEKDSYAEHTYSEWTITTVATEIDTGIQERECTVCGYKETEIIPVIEHIHNLTKVNEKPATYTEDGNIAYYTCIGCDKWFVDETGTLEITDKERVKIVKLTIEESTNQTNTDKDDTPQTGERRNIMLWIVLMFVSCLGFFLATQYYN